MKKFDVIIIGGGPAGLVASKVLVAFGKKTAIVERNKLGGDCTHSGCVPSKALLKSAQAIHDVKHISKYGLSSNKIEVDTSNVLDHVRDIVAEIYSHETPEVFNKTGVDIIEGHASFKNKNQIEVDGTIYQAKKFIIASGATAAVPNITGIQKVNYLTNENVFLQKNIPESMIIIGTGAIGIEMACAFNRLGTKVTVLARSEGILKGTDNELSNILQQELIKEGIEFLSKIEFVKIEEKDAVKSLHVKHDKVVKTIKANEVLIATGRVPNLDMNLEKAGVEYDRSGVKVDEYLQTSVSNIYAMGDVSTKYKFTHIAEQEAIVAASNVGLPIINKKMKYDNIGFCVFAQPEIAQIGLTSQDAMNMYEEEVKVYKFEYKNTDRGYTDNDKVGLIKVSVLRNGKIVGASILGSKAGELIHILQLAKTFDISFDKLSKMVYLYPTYADVIKQPSKQFYIAKLFNNPILKFLNKIKSFFKGK